MHMEGEENTLISLGSLIREGEEISQNTLNIDKNIVFLVEEKHEEYYQHINSNNKASFLINPKLTKINQNFNISKIVDLFLKDPTSLLILSRRNGIKSYSNYPMNLYTEVIQHVNASLDFLLEFNIKRLISFNTPHANTWFLFQTAEYIGLDVYIIRETVSPLYSRVYRGILRQEPFNKEANLEDKALIKRHIKKLIKLKTSGYEEAIPGFEKKRLVAFNGKYTGIISEIKNLNNADSFTLKRTLRAKLSLLRSAIIKSKYLSKYNSISIECDLKKVEYAVFFMHYQPERTSIPEAGSYAIQAKAIMELRLALPIEYRLIVKEHPSTFRNNFSKGFRSMEFYKMISSMEGVDFVSLDTDPFELIDSAIFVSTLTGTIGSEALFRNKKVIVFGNSVYTDYQECLRVSSYKELEAALKNILFLKGGRCKVDTDFYDYLYNTLLMSHKNTHGIFSCNALEWLLINNSK
jgi:hypothetical protein